MHFVCSNVSVLVLPSVSHLSFISALILDSYVPHDYNDKLEVLQADRNVYESQQNLGQELGAGKACLGSKWFVAVCSNVVFVLWFIFIG